MSPKARVWCPTGPRPRDGPGAHRSALVPGQRRRNTGVRTVPPPAVGGDVEGPHRLWQDALCRTHGVAAAAASDHHLLPRRPDGQRPRRPLPGAPRRNRLAGRAAHARCARRRDLLPGRGSRSPAGHDRRVAPPQRPPAHPADRQDRRDRAGRAGLPARGVLQPGLPAHDEGPQAQLAPALRGPGLRVSRRRDRSADRHARRWHRHRPGARPGGAGQPAARPARPRVDRGAQHPASDRCGTAAGRWCGGAHRLLYRHRGAAVRRAGAGGRHARPGGRHLRVGVDGEWPKPKTS